MDPTTNQWDILQCTCLLEHTSTAHLLHSDILQCPCLLEDTSTTHLLQWDILQCASLLEDTFIHSHRPSASDANTFLKCLHSGGHILACILSMKFYTMTCTPILTDEVCIVHETIGYSNDRSKVTLDTHVPSIHILSFSYKILPNRLVLLTLWLAPPLWEILDLPLHSACNSWEHILASASPEATIIKPLTFSKITKFKDISSGEFRIPRCCQPIIWSGYCRKLHENEK